MNNLQALTGGANLATSNLASSDLSGVNVLIGINGSGKTVLLERIRAQIIDSRVNTDLITNVASMREDEVFDEDVHISGAFKDMVDYDPDYMSKALALIQDIYPFISEVYVDECDDYLYAATEHTSIDVTIMGAGFVSLLSIIANVFIAKGGFLCLDGLGRGLHISASESVARFIIENALKNNTQVFVSTHCPSVLNAFQTVCKELNTHLTLINVKSAYQLPNDVIDVEVLT